MNDPKSIEALAKRLEGVEITAVRANRELMGTTPVTKANEDAREAAATLRTQAIEIERLREALEGIYIYANDTLSGRADGGPDDRAWQRAAVIEIRNRAREFAATQGAVDARAALNREPET